MGYTRSLPTMALFCFTLVRNRANALYYSVFLVNDKAA